MEISKSLRSLRWKQWIYKTEKITILIVFMGTNWNIFSVFQQIIKTTQLLICKSFIFKKSLFKKFISKKSLFKNQVINCLITNSSPNNSKKHSKVKKITEIKGFANVFLLKKTSFSTHKCSEFPYFTAMNFHCKDFLHCDEFTAC